jgi:hypothetical protein
MTLEPLRPPPILTRGELATHRDVILPPSDPRPELVRADIATAVARLETHGFACVLRVLRTTPLDSLAWAAVVADLKATPVPSGYSMRAEALAALATSRDDAELAVMVLAHEEGVSVTEWVNARSKRGA